MPETVLVNGNAYSLLKLLGKGKGGYSYLAQMADGQQVVVKQIHHEPCAYYQFGNKIEAELRDYNHLHFIQCACKFTDTCTTCTNNETKSKRMEVKNLIREMKKTNPGVEAHIFRSMENVSLDAVIAYKTKGRKIHFLDNYDNPDGGIEE